MRQRRFIKAHLSYSNIKAHLSYSTDNKFLRGLRIFSLARLSSISAELQFIFRALFTWRVIRIKVGVVVGKVELLKGAQLLGRLSLLHQDLQTKSNKKLSCKLKHTFLALELPTGLTFHPRRARGVERKVEARVIVDSEMIPSGLEQIEDSKKCTSATKNQINLATPERSALALASSANLPRTPSDTGQHRSNLKAAMNTITRAGTGSILSAITILFFYLNPSGRPE